jgi:beta-galactosidase GanA
MTIPYLKNKGNKKNLMVNDKPFIMIGGEVHNSSSSSLEYMEKVWDKADELGMNSLFLPVTWSC